MRVKSHISSVESGYAESLLIIADIAQCEVEVFVEVDRETAQVGIAACVYKFHADGHVASVEVRNGRAYRIHFSFEVDVLEKRQHFAIKCRITPAIATP